MAVLMTRQMLQFLPNENERLVRAEMRQAQEKTKDAETSTDH